MHTLGRLHGRFQFQRLFLPSSFSFSSSLVSPKLTRASSTRSAGPPPSQYQATKTYSDTRSDMMIGSLLSSMSRAESFNSSMEILGRYKEPLSVFDQLQVLKAVSETSIQDKATNMKSSPLKSNEIFQKLCNDIMGDLHLFSLPDLVQLLSCFSKLRTNINPRAADTVLSLIEESGKSLSELPPQDIGSIIKSLAFFNIRTGRTELIDHIVAIVVYQLTSETFDCHVSLRRVCRGFAILGRWPKELTDPLLEYLYRSIDVMDDFSVATIIWSLQKSNIPLEDWIFEKASTLILESESTIVVSFLLWVSGKSLHYYNKEFYDKMKEILLSSDSEHWCDPRLLSHMLWMLAKVRHYDPVLLDRAAEVALPLLYRMESQSLSLFVYVYGFFNHPSPALFKALEELLVSNRSTYELQGSQAFTIILWSFLVLELYPVPLIEQVFKDEFIKVNNYLPTVLQLDNASMTNPHLSLPSLSPSQRSSILSQTLTEKPITKSKLEKNIRETLNKLLHSSKGDSSYLFNAEKLHIPEAYMPNGYSVDAEILLDANDDPIPPGNQNFKWSQAGLKQLCMEDVPVSQKRLSKIFKDTKNKGEGLYNISSGWTDGGRVAAAKRRIIIEIEGPFHYAVNIKHELGKSVIKRRQLEAFGWEFIQVPYYKWYPFRNNYKAKWEYLKRNYLQKKTIEK
uniref:RAP domain-containing protein n=1 Tax=Amphimedon queenslandica TaxID=400682 RepID=A0A1X7U652_AMPQE